MVILQDVYNLFISSGDLLFRLIFRGIAVVLQLVLAALRVAGFIIGILIRVVVRQGHLSKLLLRGEGLSARLQVLQTKHDYKIIKILQLTGLDESSTLETSWKPR